MDFDIVILIAAAICLLGCSVIGFWKGSPAGAVINSHAQQIRNWIGVERAHLTPASKYLLRPLLWALRRADLWIGGVEDDDYRAALWILSGTVLTLAAAFFVYHLVELASDHPKDSVWILVAIVPLLVGAGVTLWVTPEAHSLLNTRSASADAYHAKLKTRETKFARYGLRPAAWGFKQIHALTDNIEDHSLRAGVRVSAWIYWFTAVAVVALVAITVAIEIVLAIIAIVIALMVFGAVVGGSAGGGGGGSYGGRRERVTRRETDFWGRPRDVVYENGTKVGEARTEERGGFLGIGAETVKVEYDTDGNEVSVTRREERGGFLGIGARDVEVHYADGRETGQTNVEERGGLLGIGARPVGVTRNNEGDEVAQTEWEERGGILGIGAERVKATRKADE